MAQSSTPAHARLGSGEAAHGEFVEDKFAHGAFATAAPVDRHVDIGGYLAAADPGLVRARGYTHILKLFPDDRSYPGGFHRHPGVRYLVVPADDAPGYPLDAHFRECLGFIRDAVGRGGRVLVHCHAGISRSASIVLLHLMANRGLPLGDAWARLRAARPIVNPNPGFMQLLVAADGRLGRARQLQAAERGGGPPRFAPRPPGRA